MKIQNNTPSFGTRFAFTPKLAKLIPENEIPQYIKFIEQSRVDGYAFKVHARLTRDNFLAARVGQLPCGKPLGELRCPEEIRKLSLLEQLKAIYVKAIQTFDKNLDIQERANIKSKNIGIELDKPPVTGLPIEEMPVIKKTK